MPQQMEGILNLPDYEVLNIEGRDGSPPKTGAAGSGSGPPFA